MLQALNDTMLVITATTLAVVLPTLLLKKEPGNKVENKGN
jgi:hypothetical protein